MIYGRENATQHLETLRRRGVSLLTVKVSNDIRSKKIREHNGGQYHNVKHFVLVDMP